MAGRVGIVIAQEVRDESLAKPEAYDAQLIGQMLKEGRIQLAGSVSHAMVAEIKKQFRIDVGEAVSLLIAKGEQWVIGIDDGPGIRAAKILGIPFVTALQVLIGLYEQGFMDRSSAMAKLESLEKWGRYQVQLVEDARSKIKKER
jgi:predicted nucleic acid-binding protein